MLASESVFDFPKIRHFRDFFPFSITVTNLIREGEIFLFVVLWVLGFFGFLFFRFATKGFLRASKTEQPPITQVRET